MGYHTNPPPTSNPPASFLRLEVNHQAKPPASVWHCAYCGQSNAAEREGCRGCQAPKVERSARVRESVTTWKGVPLSELTEEEREEAAEYLVGEMRDGPRPMPAILTMSTGYGDYIEKGAEPLNRLILQRLKQCVGLR